MVSACFTSFYSLKINLVSCGIGANSCIVNIQHKKAILVATVTYGGVFQHVVLRFWFMHTQDSAQIVRV